MGAKESTHTHSVPARIEMRHLAEEREDDGYVCFLLSGRHVRNIQHDCAG